MTASPHLGLCPSLPKKSPLKIPELLWLAQHHLSSLTAASRLCPTEGKGQCGCLEKEQGYCFLTYVDNVFLCSHTANVELMSLGAVPALTSLLCDIAFEISQSDSEGLELVGHGQDANLSSRCFGDVG